MAENENKPDLNKSTGVQTRKEKAIAVITSDRFKFFGIIVCSLLFVFFLSLGLILGLRNSGSNGDLPSVDLPGDLPEEEKPVEDIPSINDPSWEIPYINSYKNTARVGHYSEVLGTTARVKPVQEIKDGGLETGYPKYGSSRALSTSEKTLIIKENNLLNSSKTANGKGAYDWMDENGYLYAGTRANATVPTLGPTQLYKHSGSVGLYMGDVSDDEPAVVKKLTFSPRTYTSYYDITGLYAPAGEVIKIQLTAEDMNATGGIVVHIGQALYNGQANNIWSARALNRMPVLLNTMYVTKDTAEFDEKTGLWTAYVGSFLGGPIYVRDERVTFSVTVSGGVNYAHFILGVTTEEEYNELRKSSAPYFDLEVWDKGVLHSGPYHYAKNFSYDDLYKSAILWEKVALVSTSNSNQGIVFLYDPFVAAGAAVAFPGRRSVNCPAGWLTSSLNYNAIVTSGSWGNFHEYNHNFQNYGIGDTGEVTNNGLNLVSYSLFTKISSARQLASYGGAGLSGWNQYTSATWAQQRVNSNNIRSTSGLAVYSVLLHNLGQDMFLKARGNTGANYFNKFAELTHLDFDDFASRITGYTGNKVNPATTNYPTFVPVSCVYQTGRSYAYDGEKKYITTMQPYVIPFGEKFTVDLNPYSVNGANQYESGSVVVGNGFTYKIKKVNASGANGTFTETSQSGVYTFTPNSQLRSGKIYVTLEIYTADEHGEAVSNMHRGIPLDDVDLVLEFQQSHETNKSVLERTAYTFASGEKYTDAREAFEKGYRGAIKQETVDNKNFSQNSNTDVWQYADIDEFTNDPRYSPYIVDNNQILEIKGKLFFPEAGKYRIYMRGRISCALYISRDSGRTYELGAYIQEEKAPATGSADFRLTDSRTYIDVEVEAEEWIYFKEVLISGRMGTGRTCSYVGLGLGTWTTPMYTTTVKYYDADGNEVTDPENNADIIVRSETLYFDSNGHQVSENEASNVEPIAPTSASYVTAYRQSYEFSKEFESEYFYERTYNYNYDDMAKYSGKPTLVSVSHGSWNDSQTIDKLLDGNVNTVYHSQRGVLITEDKPFELVVDLGAIIRANHITFYSYAKNAIGNRGMPVTFTLYGSRDGRSFYPLVTRVDMEYSTKELTFDFEISTLRYYKIYVTKSDNGYFAMSEFAFYYNTLNLKGNGNNHISPDREMFAYKGSWRNVQAVSNFGTVRVGEKGASVQFEFVGSRFGIISSKYFGKNYEVYVDGKLVESIEVKANDGAWAVSYLTPELENVNHSVVIKCTGEANIDSFLFY